MQPEKFSPYHFTGLILYFAQNYITKVKGFCCFKRIVHPKAKILALTHSLMSFKSYKTFF